MNLKWCYVILGIFVIASTSPENEINISLQLAGFDYEDACNTAAESNWVFIQNPNKSTLKLWEVALNKYGSLKYQKKKEIDAEINTLMNGTELSSSIEYKSNLATKPGDALLEPEDWKNFISFITEAESLRLTGNYTSGTDNLYREDAEHVLAHIGTAEDKLKTWTSWHQTLKPLTTKLSNNLQLVHKAAIADGAKDVEKYWEMLSEYENGYTDAKYKWKEISKLHAKIVKFIRTRLSLKYKDAIQEDALPAHLLGTLQGNDWTSLAMDIIPYPDDIYVIRKNLLQEDLVGLNLYKSASRLANVMLKHVPEAQFFNESNFQGQCPPRLINFCKQGKMRIITCSEPSIANYLSAHKDIARILIHQMSEEASPILNIANRYSAIEEGVSEMLGVLAASQAWLSSLNLVNETEDLDQAQLVSIMITALDVLPRMAYYLGADMWRIDAIKNNTFDPEHLTTSWWKYRLEYEKVSSSDEELPTFLDDEYILKNKPYLSKFIGVILGFQIYEYLMESTDVKTNKIEASPLNHSFIKMIKYGSAKSWYDTTKQYLEFSDVSPDSLLSYFSPLDQYLDELNEEENVNLPLNLEEELETLEDKYIEDLNRPTTPTTTTTTITTTTVKPITTVVPKKEISKSSKISNERPSNMEPAKPQTTNVPFATVKSSGIQSDAVKKSDEALSEDIDDDYEDQGGNKLIKDGMSTAVWAVGSVLVATIAIVLIAIFGRRRCRKTPKNRRYV